MMAQPQQLAAHTGHTRPCGTLLCCRQSTMLRQTQQKAGAPPPISPLTPLRRAARACRQQSSASQQCKPGVVSTCCAYREARAELLQTMHYSPGTAQQCQLHAHCSVPRQLHAMLSAAAAALQAAHWSTNPDYWQHSAAQPPAQQPQPIPPSPVPPGHSDAPPPVYREDAATQRWKF